MRQTQWMTAALLTLSLVGCTAKSAGDFCDIAEPIRLSPDVAKIVVKTDRPEAKKIAAQNIYGQQNCGW